MKTMNTVLVLCAAFLSPIAAFAATPERTVDLRDLSRYEVNETENAIEVTLSADMFESARLVVSENSQLPKVTGSLGAQCLFSTVERVTRQSSTRTVEIDVSYELNWDDGSNECLFLIEQPNQKPLQVIFHYSIND